VKKQKKFIDDAEERREGTNIEIFDVPKGEREIGGGTYMGERICRET